jgi:hypothetical protein
MTEQTLGGPPAVRASLNENPHNSLSRPLPPHYPNLAKSNLNNRNHSHD